MLALDHLAVTAETLDDGVATVEAALGVALAGGGAHPYMSTHNRLLGLGDIYLEVIAPDPAAPPPPHPRWFDMDNFHGAPRLTNWIARCDDLDRELALGPPGIGAPVALTRGDLAWRMGVPADGRLPFDGAFPALIQWQGAAHPATRLPDAGVRLRRLTIRHPRAEDLAAALAGRLHDDRIALETGPEKAMLAVLATPHGDRAL